MEITGRITADAIVKNLTDGRQLVSFDIAVNDFYRTREGEQKKVVTFFDCAYWITTKVAPYLGKGCIVELYGHVGVHAYKDADGNPQASLNFHVNNIRFIAAAPKAASIPAGTAPAEKEDLPF